MHLPEVSVAVSFLVGAGGANSGPLPNIAELVAGKDLVLFNSLTSLVWIEAKS